MNVYVWISFFSGLIVGLVIVGGLFLSLKHFLLGYSEEEPSEEVKKAHVIKGLSYFVAQFVLCFLLTYGLQKYFKSLNSIALAMGLVFMILSGVTLMAIKQGNAKRN